MSFDRYVQQAEPQTKIWRYMDFAKFVSLLDKDSLFFVQVKYLDDEGHLDTPPGSDLWHYLQNIYETHPRSWWLYLVVSCWHMSDDEVDNMWGRYIPVGNQGVAIQSRVERLLQSLDCSGLEDVRDGKVNYFELRVEPGPEGAGVEVNYFHRDPAYMLDQEYRVLAHAKDIPPANKQRGCTYRAT
jgi:hypothetical protein